MPPTVESTRAFGSPAASGRAPTLIPSPTKRRKFDHITTDAIAGALTRLREPTLELVVELDGVRDEEL